MTRTQALLVAAPVVGLVFAAAFFTLRDEPPPPPPPEPPPVVEPEPEPEPPREQPNYRTLDPADPRALTFRYPEPEARAGLVALLDDPERTTRVHAIRGLMRWVDSVDEFLLRIDGESDPVIAGMLINSIGSIGSQHHIGPLKTYAEAEGRPPRLKLEAEAAIEKIYKREGVLSPAEQERLNENWRREAEQQRLRDERLRELQARDPEAAAKEAEQQRRRDLRRRRR